jgi:hypothetical protein
MKCKSFLSLRLQILFCYVVTCFAIKDKAELLVRTRSKFYQMSNEFTSVWVTLQVGASIAKRGLQAVDLSCFSKTVI